MHDLVIGAARDRDLQRRAVVGRDRVDRALHGTELAAAVERDSIADDVAGAAAATLNCQVVASVIANAAPPGPAIAPLSTLT